MPKEPRGRLATGLSKDKPQDDDPMLVHHFRVELDSTFEAGFAECSGLQVETEFEELSVGGVNDTRVKLPKTSKYANLTLKRGLTVSRVLFDWHQEVVHGKFQRKTVSVVAWDWGDSRERWRWSFRDAYPVKWTGPELKADGNTVAVEVLELAHNGLADVPAPKKS
jgi:phage tail-like protein